MIEAAMIWNEPNNKSQIGIRRSDPDWSRFGPYGELAAAAIGRSIPAHGVLAEFRRSIRTSSL